MEARRGIGFEPENRASTVSDEIFPKRRKQLANTDPSVFGRVKLANIPAAKCPGVHDLATSEIHYLYPCPQRNTDRATLSRWDTDFGRPHPYHLSLVKG